MCLLHLFVEIFEPFLEKNSSHSHLLIEPIIKIQLFVCTTIEATRLVGIANKKWRQFVGSINIGCECNGNLCNFLLLANNLLLNNSLVWHYTLKQSPFIHIIYIAKIITHNTRMQSIYCCINTNLIQLKLLLHAFSLLLA